MVKEFTVTPDALVDFKIGSAISVEIFQVGQKIDVTGSSKGKGFSGVIKRHNFSSNRASHGKDFGFSIGFIQVPFSQAATLRRPVQT